MRYLVSVLVLLVGIAEIPLYADVIAYYPLDEDFSDFLGDPAKDFTPLGEPVFVPGVWGTAASFDGLNDTAYTTSFVVNDFSIAFWVKTTDVYVGGNNKFWNGKGLINADAPGCTDLIGDWGICLQDTYKAGFGIGGFCDDTFDVQSTTPINDGQWHFVCCTRNGYTGEYKIYVDQGPAEKTRFHIPVYPRKPVPMYLAAINNEPGKFLNGILDEIVFFDHVLTQAEIDDLRQNGVRLPGRTVLMDPPHGAIDIPYEVNLRWTYDGDALAERYRLYLDTDPQRVDEPNLPYLPMLIGGLEVWPAPGSEPNACFLFGSVEMDTEYFWRADVRIAEPNFDYMPGGQPAWNLYRWIPGDIWSFRGLSEPAVFTGPQDRYLLPDPLTHEMPDNVSVQFTCAVAVIHPIINFEWAKDDIPLVIDGMKYTVDNTGTAYTVSTLTIQDVNESDEGAYALKVTLDTMDSFSGPQGTLYVSSEILVHRYSFNGNVDDSVGNAHGVIVDPNEPNISFSDGRIVFDDNNDGDSSNDQSGGTNAHFVDLPNGLISSLGNNMTLMVWFTWQDPLDRRWQRVFDLGINAAGQEGVSSGGTGGNYLMLTPKNGSAQSPQMLFESHYDPDVEIDVALDTQPAPISEQVCAAISWDSEQNRMQFYINAERRAEYPLNGKLSDLDDRNNWLGRSQWPTNTIFCGSIDEFRVYNVPLMDIWIENYYLAGPDGQAINGDPCVHRPDFDTNGDCVVDLLDFAAFAEEWLQCGKLSCL